MKILNKIGLFLSSFVPLFLLVIIKELVEILNHNWTFNFLNTTLLIVVLFAFIFGVYTLVKFLKEAKTEADCKQVTVLSKLNKTDQHFLGYFSLFVLFAITFDIEMYSMALIFIVVLIMIGIVYIQNDLYFINPLLNIFGYSYYTIIYEYEGQKYQTNTFCKGQIKLNQNYNLCNKYNSLVMVVKIENK